MFNFCKLAIVIIGTAFIFGWLIRYKQQKARIFFGFFTLMYLIYSGLGASLPSVCPEYIIYYFIFTFCISLGVFISFILIKKNRYIHNSWGNFLSSFIAKYGSKVIISYYIILLLTLIYPEFKLFNLIHPPAPDVLSMLREKFQGEEQNAIEGFLSFVRTLLYPFFLLCLYRFGKQTISLALIVLGTYYIQYCAIGYLGRGAMLEALLIIVAFTYFEKPQLGKKIIIISCCFFPLLLVFFVQYSIARIGGVAENISYTDACMTLIEQECGYPEHFKTILNHCSGRYFFQYLVWLITMPLPGFFRGGIDVHFAAIFSEDMLGIARSEKGFYILLPGVVGESVFLFGKQLFWINGLIYGFLMGATYRVLSRYPQLLGLLIASAIDFAYTINRAGLFGGIPFILKILVYCYIIMFVIKKYSHLSTTTKPTIIKK